MVLYNFLVYRITDQDHTMRVGMECTKPADQWLEQNAVPDGRFTFINVVAWESATHFQAAFGTSIIPSPPYNLRCGLRGADGRSTESKITANKERGF